jgi:excisionase family DNA binding protein
MCDQRLLITVTEAAKRLGIGRSLAYTFISSGALRSVKVAGARRVLVSDLHEFVQRLKEQSSAENE